MSASAAAAVQNVLRQNVVELGKAVVRHGGHPALVQDVLRSMAAWAAPRARAAFAQALTGEQGTELVMDASSDTLTGDKLDAAFATLKLVSERLATLRGMPHQPSSCSSSEPGITIGTQSWLLPHKASHQRHWQYCYELSFTNTSNEPLQLVRKAWQVQELSGVQHSRSSVGLLGLQPVIGSGDSVSFKTAITLSSIKGSMRGEFLMKGLRSGSLFPATVQAFALTPTPQQYSDAHFMPPDLLLPGCQPAAAARPSLAVQQAAQQRPLGQQQQQPAQHSEPAATTAAATLKNGA